MKADRWWRNPHEHGARPRGPRRTGASCAIINADPTPYDEDAHAVVHAAIGEVLPAIVTAVLGRE